MFKLNLSFLIYLHFEFASLSVLHPAYLGGASTYVHMYATSGVCTHVLWIDIGQAYHNSGMT